MPASLWRHKTEMKARHQFTERVGKPSRLPSVSPRTIRSKAHGQWSRRERPTGPPAVQYVRGLPNCLIQEVGRGFGETREYAPDNP
jgi:hypothetical protein